MIDIDALKVLKEAKLRPTKQRVTLISNIYKYGNRHVNAESLHKEILDTGEKVSLATVYNTLHNLTNLGFLRQVKVNSSQNYFDTNITAHHHFFDQSNNSLIDIDKATIKIQGIPTPPDKKKISEVEVIISIKNI
ncbi:transcriptional repressor [Alphaproteobacteria bacterium]|nr:transcriptional repressor [Alphaproteobacteria bacterium]